MHQLHFRRPPFGAAFHIVVPRRWKAHVWDPYGPLPDIYDSSTEEGAPSENGNDRPILPPPDLNLFRVPDLRYLLRFSGMSASGSREIMEKRLVENGTAEVPLEGREKIAINFNSELSAAVSRAPPDDRSSVLLNVIKQLGAETEMQELVQNVARERALTGATVTSATALACVAARARDEAIKLTAGWQSQEKSNAAGAGQSAEVEPHVEPESKRTRRLSAVSFAEGLQLVEEETVDSKDRQSIHREYASKPQEEVLQHRRRAILDLDFQKMGVGGISAVVQERLRRALLSRVLDASLVRKLGLQHHCGLLLFGPPGNGKTLIARKLSNVLCAATVQYVTSADINAKWFGESDHRMRALFEPARKSREMGRYADLHLVIMDEIDSLAAVRSGSDPRNHESALNVLLACMDGIELNDQTVIVGLTNRRDKVDPALLRPGRLGVQLDVGQPDAGGRQSILEIHIRALIENELLASDVSLAEIVERTDGFSGAELRQLVDTAVTHAVLCSGVAVVEASQSFRGLVEHKSMEFALEEVSALRSEASRRA